MAEGIALLSMYNDEEDEDDDPMDVAGTAHQSPNPDGTSAPPGPTPDRTPTPPPLPSRTPPPFNGDSDRETLASPIPQSPPPSVQFTLPSRSPPPPAPPPSFPEFSDSSRPRTGALAALGIVDYAHDDTAMSPEHEEGEIVSTSHTVMETEIHILEEHFEERTPPGVGIQPDPPQPSGFPEYSAVETHITMEFTRTEVEVVEFEEPVVDSVDVEKDDPLSKFLPPPVTTKCPEELQERINKFLAYKKAGKSFNADLRNRKDYRNPDFLQHAVSYQDIDQIGTCFSKDVFDPHGYDKSDFYDELEADMKREIERKDQERKKIHKVDFVSSGTHSVTTAPMVKTSGQIPAVTAAAAASAAASGLQSVSTTSDATASRHNRKTKWDKVDSDVKIPLQSGGHDDRPTVAAHTSSSNAGSGYSAFAQQKRREAEEKKSSERKFEKRS